MYVVHTTASGTRGCSRGSFCPQARIRPSLIYLRDEAIFGLRPNLARGPKKIRLSLLNVMGLFSKCCMLICFGECGKFGAPFDRKVWPPPWFCRMMLIDLSSVLNAASEWKGWRGGETQLCGCGSHNGDFALHFFFTCLHKCYGSRNLCLKESALLYYYRRSTVLVLYEVTACSQIAREE